MSISQNFPDISPSLNLNFAGARKLDSRITFTRGSTGTYMDENGLIKTAGINQARFDHSYDGSDITSLGLLIEESRTNLLQYSQALATSPWGTFSGGGFSVSNNVTVSPDGTSNASQINANPVSGGDSVYQDVSVSGNGTYTLSIFVKGNTSNSIVLAAFFTGNSTEGFSFGYNPLTGQITGGSGTVVPYPNGWYRIYFTVTGTDALNNVLRFQVYAQSSGIAYLWGAQLEAGSFPTSYIPTTSSSVTRSADNASIIGTNFSSWYNQSEGTIVAKSSMLTDRSYSGTFRSVSQFIKTSTYNTDSIFSFINSANQYAFEVRSSNTAVASVSQSLYSPNNIFASTYKVNDYALSTKGLPVTTDPSGAVPTGIDKLCIGNVGDNNSLGCINGPISQILYYPKRLTNIQLQELTK